jgi:hypothetical protein
MLKYKLVMGGGEFFVVLNVERSNQVSEILYEGDALGCQYIQFNLSSQTGMFGHLISTATTPVDLDAAMRSIEMQRFNPELIEGEELVQSDNSAIPDGAVS